MPIHEVFWLSPVWSLRRTIPRGTEAWPHEGVDAGDRSDSSRVNVLLRLRSKCTQTSGSLGRWAVVSPLGSSPEAAIATANSNGTALARVQSRMIGTSRIVDAS